MKVVCGVFVVVCFYLGLSSLCHALWRHVRHHWRQWQYRGGYLESEHWRAFRRQWWSAHPDAVCRVCGCGHPLDLHHLTYRRRGAERDTDVLPLCRVHHDQVHAILRTGGLSPLQAVARARQLYEGVAV